MEKISHNYESGDGPGAESEWVESLRKNETLERDRANRLREFIENNRSGTILDASLEELPDLIKAAEEHESRKRALQSGDSLNDGVPKTKMAGEIIRQLLSERDRLEESKKEAA